MNHFPTGYRMCRIPAKPLMFDGTLMYNLRISGPECPDATVWKLCKDLGMRAAASLSPRRPSARAEASSRSSEADSSTRVIQNVPPRRAPRRHGRSKLLQGDACFDVGSEGCRIPLSDVALIAICRALLSEPDLLYMGQTLDYLSPQTLQKVMTTLQRYVDERGIDGSGVDVPFALRRKKLIVIITKSPKVAGYCAQHLALHADGRVDVHEKVDHAHYAWRTHGTSSEAQFQVELQQAT